MSEFLNTLFETNERVCVSETPFGIETFDVLSAPSAQYFAINPLVGTRADKNVSALRNILCEFDSGTIEQQLQVLDEVCLPYTSLVFSGNKSVHAIISLEEPCKDIFEYKNLVKQIYNYLPGVDPANSNPSRFSRLANAVRPNGTQQTLLELKGRVDLLKIKKWCNYKAPTKITPPFVRVGLKSETYLTPMTKHFLAFGSQPGRRNKDVFAAACDLFRRGFEFDYIFQRISGAVDLADSELITTIKSARKAVDSDS